MRSGVRRFGTSRIGVGQWQMAGAASAAAMAAYGRGELSRGRACVRGGGAAQGLSPSLIRVTGAGSSTVWRGTRGARRAHGRRRGQLGHSDHAQGGESRESYTWA